MESSFPSKLAFFAAAVFVAACAVAATLAVARPLPEWETVLIFGMLAIFSAHRMVRLPNGISLSPGFMICVAAIVACAPEGALLGPAIVGALGVVRVAHFKRGLWPWLPFNAGITSLAAVAAAIVYDVMPPGLTGELPAALVAVVPAAFAFVAVSWSLLVVSYAVEEGTVPRALVRELGPSLLHVLPFAVLGVVVGELYNSFGWAVMLLVVVPVLIAREMFASYMEVRRSHDETVQMLIRALEAKDRYTAGHVERVATYAQYVGEQMHFGPARMERLRFAALMHDIGKLVVPNHLLNKPGKLTEEEFARIKTHEKVSVQMLSNVEFLRPIAGVAHSDNTQFDPDDPDHPIEPYIVMIADAYDAMTSTRSYRKALPQEIAFQELRDKAGVQFHPECVEALITALQARGEKHGAGYEVQQEFENAPVAGVGSAGLGDLLPAEA
jgi:hypothetical protein